MTAGVHPMGDLAPRDVVAAAIDARLRTTGDPCVYLDARGIADFERRFPTVTAACRTAGIDPVRQPIPVIPGAHYSCGGVVTDVHGQTELPGLFAAGEVARTGMHGANRLASNSLLEGLVVGGRAGRPRRRTQCSSDIALRRRRNRPRRAALGRATAAGDEPRRLGGPRRRWPAPVDRHAVRRRRFGPCVARADLEDAALTVTARAVRPPRWPATRAAVVTTAPNTPTPPLGPACSIVVRLADDDTAQVEALAAVC